MGENLTLLSGTKKAYTLADYENAIKKARGFQAEVARLLKVSRSAVCQRIQKSARLQKVLIEARESTLDLAESKLVEAIERGDVRAIMFYLKTVGKHRGYYEGDAPHVKDAGPMKINLMWADEDDWSGSVGEQEEQGVARTQEAEI